MRELPTTTYLKGPFYWLLAIFILAGPNINFAESATNEGGKTMLLTSEVFEHNHDIPDLYTCDGRDISPPLAWENVPNAAKSLALIVYDPDAPDPKAPKMTWVHWVLYNLPPDVDVLPQGVIADNLPDGALEGLNDWHRPGYGGPCPPIGKHRYFFKLYALDQVLPDLETPSKAALEKEMAGHIIAESELIGTYKR